ncbi:GNAT family N-acetyltransferase [Spirochaeta cellobiosiphila]|uniref:GNAT family N-acetyltransferase n=1 Tax=Spirochaeta cellobiosiphila TaxID=504483 RepID=UPI00041DEA20|nr:GNAT family N-acetyltransferase [Spirochaeta cellobiosiphila]
MDIIINVDNLTPEHINNFAQLIHICNNHDQIDYSFEPEAKHFFLYYKEDKLISAIYLFAPFSEEAEVYGFTHPEYRNQGYFKSLIHSVKKYVHKIKISTILFPIDSQLDTSLGVIQNWGAQYDFSEYAMTYKGDILKENDTLKLIKSEKEEKAFLITLTKEAFNITEEEAHQRYDEIFQSNLREHFTIYKNSTMIGQIGLYVESTSCYIYGFGIINNYRSKGHGKTALKNLVAYAQNKYPDKTITLEVEVKNNNALNLYTSCGFVTNCMYEYWRITPNKLP